MISLYKVPCILVATVGLHIAATAPQPPPSADEKEIKNTMEGFMKQRSGPLAVKVLNHPPSPYAFLKAWISYLEYMLGSWYRGGRGDLGLPHAIPKNFAEDSLPIDTPGYRRADPSDSALRLWYILVRSRWICSIQMLPRAGPPIHL
jgi:hypothetical protein